METMHAGAADRTHAGRRGRRPALFRATALLAAALLVAAGASAVEKPGKRPEAEPPELAHGPAFKGTPADPGAGPRLVAKASRKGRVRVIVELEPGEPLTEDLPPARLRGLQRAFLKRLGAGKGPPPELLETIPFVALEADPLVLQRALKDAAVVSVQEDALHQTSLAESTVRIGAPGAWRTVKGDGQVVAVLDTGVAADHPMLQGKLVAEACYSSNVSGQTTSLCPGGVSRSTAAGSGASCPSTLDNCFHGTLVSSIAVGRAAANPPGAGVAPGARLASIKVFSRAGGTAVAWTSDVVRGLERVLLLSQSGVRIAAANLSFGFGSFAGACDSQQPAFAAIIRKLRAVGVPTIAAVGNNAPAGTINAPACVSSAVAVGSTLDTADRISTFSNLSRTVDLLAPGQSITGAVPGGYGTFDGTSLSSAHVAGAWALLRQSNPRAGVSQIESALKQSGVPVARNGIAVPRIDLGAALPLVAGGS